MGCRFEKQPLIRAMPEVAPQTEGTHLKHVVPGSQPHKLFHLHVKYRGTTNQTSEWILWENTLNKISLPIRWRIKRKFILPPTNSADLSTRFGSCWALSEHPPLLNLFLPWDTRRVKTLILNVPWASGRLNRWEEVQSHLLVTTRVSRHLPLSCHLSECLARGYWW